jgi:hypothetical protein
VCSFTIWTGNVARIWEKILYRGFAANQKENDNKEKLDVGEILILKRILKK